MKKPDQNYFEVYPYDTHRYENRTHEDLTSSARRNLQQLINLINRLFRRYSRLLVVRVDLLYRKDVAHLIPLEVAQQHREQLLGDRRDYPQVFDGLLGYAWGLEQGDNAGGYHFHFLAFYDGSKRQEDIGIGFAIGDLWEQITNGYGYCNISNLSKERFAREGTLGIGMIHRDDIALRINLVERVAAYLTKKAAKIVAESGRTASGAFRTFGKSWMPRSLDPSVPRRGRPPSLDGNDGTNNL